MPQTPVSFRFQRTGGICQVRWVEEPLTFLFEMKQGGPHRCTPDLTYRQWFDSIVGLSDHMACGDKRFASSPPLASGGSYLARTQHRYRRPFEACALCRSSGSNVSRLRRSCRCPPECPLCLAVLCLFFPWTDQFPAKHTLAVIWGLRLKCVCLLDPVKVGKTRSDTKRSKLCHNKPPGYLISVIYLQHHVTGTIV